MVTNFSREGHKGARPWCSPGLLESNSWLAGESEKC
jgi:hypothetical protein